MWTSHSTRNGTPISLAAQTITNWTHGRAWTRLNVTGWTLTSDHDMLVSFPDEHLRHGRRHRCADDKKRYDEQTLQERPCHEDARDAVQILLDNVKMDTDVILHIIVENATAAAAATEEELGLESSHDDATNDPYDGTHSILYYILQLFVLNLKINY